MFIREIKDSFRHLAAVWSLWVTDSSLVVVRDARTHPSAPPGGHRDKPRPAESPVSGRLRAASLQMLHQPTHSFLSEHRGLRFGGADGDPCWSTLSKPKGSPVDSVDFISDIMKHQKSLHHLIDGVPAFIFHLICSPRAAGFLKMALIVFLFLSLIYRPARWSFSGSLSPLKPILIAVLLRRFPLWNHTLKFLWWKTD